MTQIGTVEEVWEVPAPVDIPSTEEEISVPDFIPDEEEVPV